MSKPHPLEDQKAMPLKREQLPHCKTDSALSTLSCAPSRKWFETPVPEDKKQQYCNSKLETTNVNKEFPVNSWSSHQNKKNTHPLKFSTLAVPPWQIHVQDTHLFTFSDGRVH